MGAASDTADSASKTCARSSSAPNAKRLGAARRAAGEIALVVDGDGERPKDLLSVLVWPSHRVAQAQAADEARWLEVSSSREMLRKLIVVFAIVGALGVLSVLLALHYCCGGFHASDADRRI